MKLGSLTFQQYLEKIEKIKKEKSPPIRKLSNKNNIFRVSELNEGEFTRSKFLKLTFNENTMSSFR